MVVNDASSLRDPRSRVLRTYPRCSRGCGRSAVETSVLGDLDPATAGEADLETLCAECHTREENTRQARATHRPTNGAPALWLGGVAGRILT